MKNQNKLTVSNATSEINYIAKKLGVSALAIHLAKHFVGNQRKDITEWVSKWKGTNLTIEVS